jgi:uncharacterized protein YdiU (UPF0061 family)
LLGLLDPDEDRAVAIATEALEQIMPMYRAEWLAVMRAKLGLAGAEAGDAALAEGLLAAMEAGGADWTLTFRRLALGDLGLLRPLFTDTAALEAWWPDWLVRRAPGAKEAMLAVNPLYIPRNHRVEAALGAAHLGDLEPFETVLAVITDPFTERPGLEGFILPAPEGFGRYVTFCGT